MDKPIITEINLIPIRRQEKGLYGFCSFVIDNSFKVQSVAIHTRADGSGIRLVFPDRILPSGIRGQVCHPITSQFSDLLEKIINQEVQKLLSKAIQVNVKEIEYEETMET